MDKTRELDIKKQIDAYVKGNLSEDEIQLLWNEFAKNPEYLELLEVEAGVKAILSKEKMKKPLIHALPRWTWHAAAAAVIIAIGLIQLFRINTPTEIDEFLVQEINPDQIETADGLRADESGLNTADSLLNLGFEAFISGNDSRALEIFDTVIIEFDEEPYGSKAFLNKGIILYNQGQYEEAIEAFNESSARAGHSRMITEKAYWYKGNALVNLEKLEEAREAIYEAYKLEGVFRKAAFRLLQKLNYDLGNYDYEDFDTQQLN